MQSEYDDVVRLSPPLVAEAQFAVCVICALFSMGTQWEVAEGNCCCANSPFSLSHLRTKADDGQLAAEEPNQPYCIIQVLGWKIIRCPLTVLQASKLEDSARSLIECRVAWVA